MKTARELGARHVSPATDRRGRLRFLVSASCRFAGMAAPRRFLYDEAAATLHRILTTNISANRQARRRLREDLTRVLEDLPSADLSVDLAMEAVIGVMLQVLAPIGEGQLSREDREPAVGAMLGAIGAGKQRAAAALGKLRRANAAPAERRRPRSPPASRIRPRPGQQSSVRRGRACRPR